MKKYLLIGLFSIATSIISWSQEKHYTAPLNARYSPEMTEEQLYSKTFLQKMSKEDWAAFSQDPRFNADRVSQLKTGWKRERQQERSQLKTTQSSGESNCYWIEPTSEYEHPNTIQWPGSPGNSTDNYSAPINLGWNFNFFGTNYNQIVLTTKGTIVLGNTGYIDFTPSAFPNPLGTESNQQYNHIAGFWSDFDFGAIGELYYLLTPQALYINYIDVGYWPNFDDKTNSFQMIITPDGSDVIGGGNNVQFVYLDMQWANSQISGATAGCAAVNNYAIVGADRATGNEHYAYGRFNLCNSTVWDGPYGVTAGDLDGVDWLDGRVIEFNTSITNFAFNQPPTVIGEACDTITMCVGEVFDLNLAFASPEATQNTTVTYTQTGTGFSATTSNSPGIAVLNNANFVATAENIGSNTVTITATDNGVPAASTTVTYTFLVNDVDVPPIEISGVLNICAGQVTELTASEGFDSYTWSNGDVGNVAEVSQPGTVTVVGAFGFCSVVASVNIDVTPFFIPQLVGGNAPIQVCPGIDTVVCVIGDYASYQWEIMPGYDGEFVAGTPLDESCASVTGNVNGRYRILVTDSAGCQGFNIKRVNTSPSTPCSSNDLNNGIRCDGPEPLDFCGSLFPDAENVLIQAFSTNANGWQGSYINVYVHPYGGGPEVEYFFTIFDTYENFSDVEVNAGDTVIVEYFANGNDYPGNSLVIDYANLISSDTTYELTAPLLSGIVWTGIVCDPLPLDGTWSVTGPDGWTFSDSLQMTTTWTPSQAGVYELCFSNANCTYDYCYNVEFTTDPQIALETDLPILLCDNQTTELTIDITSAGNVTWNGQNVAPSANALSAIVGPFTDYTDQLVYATIENTCGSATDSLRIIYQPDVPDFTISDAEFCPNTSVTVDPIADNLEFPGLLYDWNPGTISSSTASFNSQGNYSLTVTNGCGDSSGPIPFFVDAIAPPTITLSNPNPGILCNGATLTQTANPTIPSLVGNNYSVTWTGPGVVATGNSATIGPFSDYTNATVTATITNLCGSSSGSFNVTAQPNVPEPSFPQFFLCENSSVVVDPLTSAQENPALQYSWSNGSTSPQIVATAPGVYSVTISNNCDQSNPTSAQVTLVPEATVTSALPLDTTICSANNALLTVTYANPSLYTSSWSGPVNSSNASVTATEAAGDGVYCYSVIDIHGCGTENTACIDVEFSVAPVATNIVNAEVWPLCQRECKSLSIEPLAAYDDVTYSWTSTCAGLNLSSTSSGLDFCADNVPYECLGGVVTVTGTMTNGCGIETTEWFIQSDECSVLIPNIFTPNGKNGNDTFFILGLDKYSGAELMVYNRWGNLVYESSNYKNDWKAADLTEGSYWYVLKLPYGSKTEFTGELQILR
jgi:gliding motility-associated-like protein